MPDFETEGGTTRDDLLQRVDLMEQMIAEGRSGTARFGWIFVLWGLVDLAGIALEWAHPGRTWNWPLVLLSGAVLQFVGFKLRNRAGRVCAANTQSRAISAIWGMMGATLMLYCFTAIFSHQAGGPCYIAAIFMIIGLAHAASAIILRWVAQGAVAVIWWAGGLASFFLSGSWFIAIFCAEMILGMVCFGLYAMLLEQQNRSGQIGQHA